MYIDANYYTAFLNIAAVPEDFNLLCEMASSQINAACALKINDLSALPFKSQEAVKKATVMQTKYLSDNGGALALDGGIASASIGKFSYTENSTTSEATALCKAAEMFLYASGLMFSGVAVCE